MKKLLLFLCCSIFLLACNQQPAAENAGELSNTVTETPENSTAETKKELEISPLGKLKEGNRKFTEKDYSGELDFEVDFGKGISLYAAKGWFSGVEWSCDAFELKKEGKTVYTYPDFETDMPNVLFRNADFTPEYPKMVSKGDKHLVLILRVTEPNATQIDGIKIDGGKYVGYLQNMGGDFAPLKADLAEKLFEKAFGE